MSRRGLEGGSLGGAETINTTSSLGALGESKNTITDAERTRVQENERKARQIAGQKAQQRKNDSILGKFLAILFSRLPEHIISSLYTAFFTKRNTINGSMEVPSTNHMILLAALCTPFFMEEAKNLGIYQTFATIAQPTAQSWQDYLLYSKKMISRCKLDSLIPQLVPLLWNLGIFEGLSLTDTIKSQNDIVQLLTTPGLQNN